MNLKLWNLLQIKESQSDMNRYYFHEHYGRDAENDAELLLYYIEHGAKIFSELHKEEGYGTQEKM